MSERPEHPYLANLRNLYADRNLEAAERTAARLPWWRHPLRRWRATVILRHRRHEAATQRRRP